MSKKTFEEVIEEKGELIYTNLGDSMYPLIKDRDLLVIKRPSFPLHRLDIPLYKRENGQYVLHRIIKIREHDYIICGDNRTNKEYGITEENVIGVLTHIIRNGRKISVYSLQKKLYAHLWSDVFLFRRGVLYLKRKLR